MAVFRVLGRVAIVCCARMKHINLLCVGLDVRLEPSSDDGRIHMSVANQTPGPNDRTKRTDCHARSDTAGQRVEACSFD